MARHDVQRGLRRGQGATTLTDTRLVISELFPSSPSPFKPQHFTRPAVVSAHASSLPAAMAVTPDDNPITATGWELAADELFPSSP